MKDNSGSILSTIMKNERDQALLRRHLDITENIHLHLNAWIESHGGIKFSPADVSEVIEANEDVCRRLLNDHPLVGKIDGVKKRGPQKKYISLAPPLTPTTAGLLEEAEIARKHADKLGRGAREEYYRSIEITSLSIPKEFRLKKV